MKDRCLSSQCYFTIPLRFAEYHYAIRRYVECHGALLSPRVSAFFVIFLEKKNFYPEIDK
jgi:hypothetical protein